MTHFTLVHGAWHGAWCWERVAEILRGRGHAVATVVQTGLGERAGELAPDLTLGTFVGDVLAALAAGPGETVLVGHSFGGNPITGAAADADARDRILGLVYLDAMIPMSGTAPARTVPDETWAARKAGAVTVETAAGPVLCLPPPTADRLGLFDPDDAAYVEARMTPHPISTYETAIAFDGPPGAGLPCRYIMVTDPVYAPLADHRTRCASALGWPIAEIAAGHDCMVSAPVALADQLETGASET